MTPLRYADWRPVAVRRTPAGWIGGAAGLAVMALGLTVGKDNGYLIYLAAVFVAHRMTGWLAERRMRDLRDDPEGGQFAVTLRVAREVGYGYDEGLLAFVDGWLVYSGRRCAFSVRRADVRGVVAEAKRHGFVFDGPAGLHGATFVTAEPGRLGGEFMAWSKAEDVPGDAVFPPVVPHGEARALHRSWAWLGLAASLVLAVGALLQRNPIWRVVDLALAATALPAGVAYGALAQGALRRIAAGLPYRRGRLSRLLGLRPPRRPASMARALGIKARLERKALGPSLQPPMPRRGEGSARGTSSPDEAS